MKMNLIAERVWVARKVTAGQGDHPEVTSDTEHLPGTVLSPANPVRSDDLCRHI